MLNPFDNDVEEIKLNKTLNTSSLSYELKYHYDEPLRFNSRTQRIGLKNLRLPYRFFNISSALGNNIIRYIWTDNIQYECVLPDGTFGFDGDYNVNTQFHKYQTVNGHTTTDSSGNEVFYMNIYTSLTEFRVVLECQPEPATGNTPQIVLPDSKLTTFNLGFTAGTYPPTRQTTKYVCKGTNAPNITSYNNYYLMTNLIKRNTRQRQLNVQSGNTELGCLTDFTPNTSIDGLITIDNNPYSTTYYTPTSEAIQDVSVQIYATDMDGKISPVPVQDTGAFSCTPFIITKLN